MEIRESFLRVQGGSLRTMKYSFLTGRKGMLSGGDGPSKLPLHKFPLIPCPLPPPSTKNPAK